MGINKVTLTLQEDGSVKSTNKDVDKRIINYLASQLEAWNPTVSGKWVSANIFECDQVWKESDVKANPDYIFVYGDNDQHKGEGGQAVIRYAKNGLPIRTKKAPGYDEADYYIDAEYKENIKKLDEDFAAIKKALEEGKKVVISANGYGNGLSRMPTKCPRTYEHLEKKLDELIRGDGGWR
ncbi:MAG: hypothetical protein GX776_02470 [Oxalobacter sp.]|nr:hypothetical protein [Oxalobacter sp.]